MDMSAVPTNLATVSSMSASATSTMVASGGGGAMTMALGGMDMTSFSFSTDVTLFFAGWRTDTTAKYFGTLVFTFLLTLFTRFLGAWRSQLGYKWANQAAVARAEHLHRRRRSERNRRRKEDEGSFGRDMSHCDEHKAESEPFSASIDPSTGSNSPDGMDTEVSISKEEQILASLGPRWTRFLGSRWRAGHPWKIGLDGPRALLEGLRAFFGYLL